MGRGGKKKGDKKVESADPTTSETLDVPATTAPVPTVSASAPTTAATAPIESDDEGGLGLGGEGKKRKPRKKKKNVQESKEAVAVSEPTVPAVASTSSGSLHKDFPALQIGGDPPPPQDPLDQPVPKPWGAPQEPTQIQSSQNVGMGRGRGRGRGIRPFPLPQKPPMAALFPAPQAVSIQQGAIPKSTQVSVPSPPTETFVPPKPQHEAPSLFKVPPKFVNSRSTVRSVPSKVLTNYLKMIMEPKKIYRYDIIFKPDKAKKLLPIAFDAVKKKHFPKCLIAFDQIKNCYSLTALPGVPATDDRLLHKVEITDNNGKVVPFEVSFKQTGLVDLGRILQYIQSGGTSLSPPTEAIQCVDVILRQGTLEQYVKCGRQFYKRPANPIDLSDGLEIWTGLFQSAIFGSACFVNIDVVHKGFPKSQPLIQTLMNDFRLDPSQTLPRNWSVTAFEEYLKGIRVVAAIGGDLSAAGQKREFLCNGLVGPANRETFDYVDMQTGRSQKMTVADFFTKIKGCRLKYPNLNCVWVGSRTKTIYYPMELLYVAYGQLYNRQLSERQLANMVREAATPPDDRKRKIEEIISAMNYSNNDTFKKFGLKIDNRFHAVEAKILAPPVLAVGPGRTLMPRQGAWQSNGLYKPEPLRSWGIIAIDTSQSCDFQNIINLMMKVSTDMGMQTSRPEMTHFNASMRDFQNILFKALENRIKFLFVVVGTRAKDLYHKVKRTAERDVGILTQCIKEVTATRRMNPQTARNILLKVNSKLMGINQVLDVKSLPACLSAGDVMVVGADVTHPAPGQSTVPSIAAVTASIDPTCYQYNIELSVQTSKKEMIVQFEDMMVDHLKVYRQRQNKLPRKIYIFRDGVSEGQFSQVMSSELTAVHRAYCKLTGNPNIKPEVLFLLVQKRHHTRLFIPDSKYNVEPGTVVDKEIVHASELDFYLVSHQAIKGTARPTRYHAICNDGKISADEVEQLTYYLCHLYSRCMRSVSYPTPTYYAHLACLRAKSLTYGDKFDNEQLERQPIRLHVMDDILRASRMFFV